MKKHKFIPVMFSVIVISFLSCDKDMELDDKPISWGFYMYDIDNNIEYDYTEIEVQINTFSLINSYGPFYKVSINGSEDSIMFATNFYNTDLYWSVDGNKCVYSRNGNLYLNNTDGTNEHQITNSEIGFWKPIMSYDGQYFACSSDRGLCIVSLDGNIKIISSDNSATWYDWSADSKNLVYSKYVDGKYAQIFLYNIDKDVEFQLSSLQKYNYDPYWRPDKDEILFTSSLADYGSDLILMNADGSDQKTIFHKNRINSFTWASDGLKIALVTNDTTLAILDFNGDNYIIINKTKSLNSWDKPFWSTDSKYILYSHAGKMIN